MVVSKMCKGLAKTGLSCKKRTTHESGYCNIHQIVSIENCPVCYEEISQKEALQCSHLVHIDCIKQSMKPECPICRAVLTLPPDVMDVINQNAEKIKMEWEEEDRNDLVEELRNEFMGQILINYIFDVYRSGCTCESCSGEINPTEEVMVLFEEMNE